MERALTHVGSVGGGGGSSCGSVVSTMSREEQQCSNNDLGLASHEASSSYLDEVEIELGLGLSLNGVVSKKQGPRILTGLALYGLKGFEIFSPFCFSFLCLFAGRGKSSSWVLLCWYQESC